jgi:hypothetical protein
MIATGARIDPGRPSELTPHDDCGALEQAALIEIVDQGAHALVKLPAMIAH